MANGVTVKKITIEYDDSVVSLSGNDAQRYFDRLHEYITEAVIVGGKKGFDDFVWQVEAKKASPDDQEGIIKE